MNTTDIYKNTDRLQLHFRSKVELFLKACPEIRITETWRSQERQNMLYRQGKSKVKYSNHQAGLAVDICFKGSLPYPPVHINGAINQQWRRIGDVAKRYGIDWGYDLWHKSGFIDCPHFQDNQAFKTPQKIDTKDLSTIWDTLEAYKKRYGGIISPDEISTITDIQARLHTFAEQLRA